MEDHIAEVEDAKPTKNFSIWSLLVVTTLLAVVLAVPKPKLINYDPMLGALYAGCHQVAFCGLVGALIWMLLGKRRSVLICEAIVVLLIWGPLFLAIIEDLTAGNGAHPFVTAILSPLGLYDTYGKLYQWIFKTFGYGPF